MKGKVEIRKRNLFPIRETNGRLIDAFFYIAARCEEYFFVKLLSRSSVPVVLGRVRPLHCSFCNSYGKVFFFVLRGFRPANWKNDVSVCFLWN